MVKLGPGITEINGKTGGNVYRVDQCGQHIQKKPKTVKKKSPLQYSQQMAWIKASNFWLNHWTIQIYNAWWVYSSLHPIVNKKGEVRYRQPFNAFMHINVIRARNVVLMLLWPPSD